MDLVAATGTEKYLYEGSQARPSPYLHPGQTTDEVIRGHALEEGLPKLVIGLTGIQQLLQGKLQALDRSGDWKKRVLRQAGEAALADPEASKREIRGRPGGMEFHMGGRASRCEGPRTEDTRRFGGAPQGQH
jgi:hypothetical protein